MASNWQINMIGSLDENASRSKINGQIEQLKGKLKELTVDAKIDIKSVSSVQDQLDKLQVSLSNVKIDNKALNGMISQINNTLKGIQIQGVDFVNLTKQSGQIGQEISTGFKQGASAVEQFKKSLSNAGKSSSEIENIVQKVESLKVVIDSLKFSESTNGSMKIDVSGLDEFGNKVKVTQSLMQDLQTMDWSVSDLKTSIISTKEIEKVNNAFADFTSRLAQFKSTNSEILSGLSEPLSSFENKLSGLKNGTATIDEVKNSFKALNAEASNITANFSRQLSPIDSAINSLSKGKETIAGLKAEFKGLDNAPKEINTELNKCVSLLQNVKKIESQEGRTANWSEAYREWASSVDALKAKLTTLKKEQSNVASTQIFKISDLKDNDIAYMSKVFNTIEKQMSRINQMARGKGWDVVDVSGVEQADGKIKKLTLTIKDAEGILKKFDMQREKLQGNGKAQDGLMQVGDVKILETATKAREKFAESVKKTKSEIESSINNNKFSVQIDKIEESFQKYGISADEAKNKVSDLRSTLESMSNTSSDEKLVSDFERFQQQIKDVNVELDKTKLEFNSINQIDNIKFSVEDNGKTTTQIETLRNNFSKLGLSADEVKSKMNDVDKEFAQLKSLMSSGGSNSAITGQFDKLKSSLESTQNDLKKTRSEYSLLATEQQRLALANNIEAWNQKNTRATKEVREENQKYIDTLRNLDVEMTKVTKNDISIAFGKNANSMRTLNKLGASLKDQMKQAASSFTQWVSVSSVIMGLVYNVKKAITELKDLDNILTEISKTSDLTKAQLSKLGDSSFNTASKYGQKASDYLTGVQEMYRAGFNNAPQMAELSVLAQSAGDMKIDSANDYLMATNAAYEYKGSIESLNEVLDRQNYVTNNAAVSMQDMADATSEAASISAQYGVGIDELSAMIATIASKTRESGSEVGTALRSLFVTLQDTTSKPVRDTFDLVGISMTKMVNGSKLLKTPIELLKELSEVFRKLPEGDVKRSQILSKIGKKYHANSLAAVLDGWSDFEKMMDLYESNSAVGSAMKEAEKSSNNLQGSLNKLSNQWTATVENISNSNDLKACVNVLNSFLTVVNKLTDALGLLGTAFTGAGLITGLKNTGNTILVYGVQSNCF